MWRAAWLVVLMVGIGGCAKKPAHVEPVARPVLLAEDSPAANLANAVLRASGAPRWGMVRSVSFRIVVREGDRVILERRHVWDVLGGVDGVRVGDSPETVVNLANPDMNDPVQADAYRAWGEDTFWFTMPLRLSQRGVSLEYGGSEVVKGKGLEVLRVRLDAGGPPTPARQFTFYVDPLTSLPMYADLITEGEGEVKTTCEGYRNVGPFKLSTLHRWRGEGADSTVTIEDLRVVW
jgi:hypothetical protein